MPEDTLGPVYKYNAICTNVVDGDTVDLEVDLGFTVKVNIRGRLARINSPERKKATMDAWHAARKALAARIETEHVLVQSFKTGSMVGGSLRSGQGLRTSMIGWLKKATRYFRSISCGGSPYQETKRDLMIEPGRYAIPYKNYCCTKEICSTDVTSTTCLERGDKEPCEGCLRNQRAKPEKILCESTECDCAPCDTLYEQCKGDKN